MNSPITYTFLLAICFGFLAPAMAQDRKSPPVFVRFLPLGEKPPTVRKIEDGVIVEQEPPPGAEPPNAVWVRAIKGENKKVRLKLGSTFAYKELNPEAENANLFSEANGGQPWLKMKMPKVPLSTAVLLRRSSGPKASWNQAGALVFKDDLKSFPRGTFRLVNVSPFTVQFRLGEEKSRTLKPREVAVIPIKDKNRLLDARYVGKNGKPKRLATTKLQFQERERMNGFIYELAGRRSGTASLKLFPENFKMPKPSRRTPKPANSGQ